MKPFLKWFGHRQRLASEIRGGFPANYRRYYEPFLGGGSVFLGLEPRTEVEVLGDINPWLMDCYRALKDNCEEVISILGSLVPCVETYKKLRSIHPDHIELSYRAAHLIYLNQLAFGNVFRLNRDGYFNVPFGKGVESVFESESLREISQRLRGTRLITADFAFTLAESAEGDFVFLDPPSGERRSFGYSGNRPSVNPAFGASDYLRLLDICISLSKRGVLWALSDENTSLVRLMFSEFYVYPLYFDRRLGDCSHILVTNYDTLNNRLLVHATESRFV